MSPESMSLEQRPVETGISKEHFLTQDWYERDLEAVWRPRWHYAAHESELSEPRSYVTFKLGDDEVIITRLQSGALTAYFNVCRHRGYPLAPEGNGKLGRNFVCQYHGWAFSTEDGACVSATKMHEGFDKTPWGLHKAWVEAYNGLVFVSLSREKPVGVTESFTSFADSEGAIAGYDLSGLKVAAVDHVEVAANWKLVVENDDECYHCSLNHPELVKTIDPWHTFTVVEDLDKPQRLWTQDDWSIEDLTSNPYSQDAGCRVPLPRQTAHEGDELPIVQVFWQPSGHMVISPDNVWIWTIRPLGPQLTIATSQFLVAADAEEGRDYDIESLTSLVLTTLGQDAALCEGLQKGLRMQPFKPGPLNPHHQGGIIEFYRWYQRCLNVTQPA
ncbi:aromatic ring-hydroxylating dioxygenase subunit alpha [Mycolicibacterium sp. CBMA 226]|uniref:aromatic ring-hydroxylating oxygenase subunit alpha n=1 Tax=Mycolicibacterium sp. CBMA 226 TaxID=2606611 RepID=UPI0013170AEE|nr:aromatic ring-hydroxylating dioxygenase subunit alpha [Mycolicibacterium sp. CBMA 226]QGW61384.1 Anthranilate 1,2-dioxygenase large subunit [Mycolicibacterium sp.]